MPVDSDTHKVVLCFQLEDDAVISSTENQECISDQKGGFDNSAVQEEMKLVESSNHSMKVIIYNIVSF